MRRASCKSWPAVLADDQTRMADPPTRRPGSRDYSRELAIRGPDGTQTRANSRRT